MKKDYGERSRANIEEHIEEAIYETMEARIMSGMGKQQKKTPRFRKEIKEKGREKEKLNSTTDLLDHQNHMKHIKQCATKPNHRQRLLEKNAGKYSLNKFGDS